MCVRVKTCWNFITAIAHYWRAALGSELRNLKNARQGQISDSCRKTYWLPHDPAAFVNNGLNEMRTSTLFSIAVLLETRWAYSHVECFLVTLFLNAFAKKHCFQIAGLYSADGFLVFHYNSQIIPSIAQHGRYTFASVFYIFGSTTLITKWVLHGSCFNKVSFLSSFAWVGGRMFGMTLIL